MIEMNYVLFNKKQYVSFEVKVSCGHHGQAVFNGIKEGRDR